jgi:hypothetical protein
MYVQTILFLHRRKNAFRAVPTMTENWVLEDEIHVKVVIVESESLLPRLKEKPPAKFQQKAFQPVDDGRFKFVTTP